MPVDPSMGAVLARPVGDVYTEAELRLLRRVASELGRDLGSPRWPAVRLAGTGVLMQQTRQQVTALQRDVTAAMDRAVRTAYQRGATEAQSDLKQAGQARGHPVAETAVVAALVAAAVATQRPVWQRLLHAPLDVYRRVIARGTVVVDRRTVVQRELDRWADTGIVGFQDGAGRQWQASGYAETVTRTSAGHAAVQGAVDVIRAAGQDLVAVSVAPLACPLCVPWEGQILSLGGPDPRAKGTLAEAMAAGLFHVNCRHAIRPWVPGTPLQQVPPHPEGATYRDVQRQRYYERQTRAWRRREAVALDPATRRKAQAKVREYTARIRALTSAKGLERYPARER